MESVKSSPAGAFFRIRTTTMMSYLKEVKAELKNVKWPSFEQTIIYTIAVLFVSAVVGLSLMGLDLGLKELLAKALRMK